MRTATLLTNERDGHVTLPWNFMINRKKRCRIEKLFLNSYQYYLFYSFDDNRCWENHLRPNIHRLPLPRRQNSLHLLRHHLRILLNNMKSSKKSLNNKIWLLKNLLLNHILLHRIRHYLLSVFLPVDFAVEIEYNHRPLEHSFRSLGSENFSLLSVYQGYDYEHHHHHRQNHRWDFQNRRHRRLQIV